MTKIEFPIDEFMSQITRNWDRKATYRMFGEYDNRELVWQVILKRYHVSNHDLKNMFKYHKLEETAWLIEWQMQSLSNSNTRVILFIRKELNT